MVAGTNKNQPMRLNLCGNKNVVDITALLDTKVIIILQNVKLTLLFVNYAMQFHMRNAMLYISQQRQIALRLISEYGNRAVIILYRCRRQRRRRRAKYKGCKHDYLQPNVLTIPSATS